MGLYTGGVLMLPNRALIGGLAMLAALTVTTTSRGAEQGTGPWLEGYTDIMGGYLPSDPGFYTRVDAYSYSGGVGTTIFNGRVQLNVDMEYTSTIAAMSSVTPWKLFGGT